jgi:hypothetical protein
MIEILMTVFIGICALGLLAGILTIALLAYFIRVTQVDNIRLFAAIFGDCKEEEDLWN